MLSGDDGFEYKDGNIDGEGKEGKGRDEYPGDMGDVGILNAAAIEHDQMVARNTALARTMKGGNAMLRDFTGMVKIGGRNVDPRGGGGGRRATTQHGVCSWVYTGVYARTNARVAIKVILNITAGYETVDIDDEFELEFSLIANQDRLPWHPNIICALHMFIDKADTLPEWDFDPDIVQPKTQIVVLPLLKSDLKRYQTKNPVGMSDALLLNLAEQLLKAVVHLHDHRIVHRDIKADNVMIRIRKSDGKMEFVLIDFGCALDCTENGFDGFRMPFNVRGLSKGGAPAFLAPEVARAKSGPVNFIDYNMADGWACGMLLHGAMCVGFARKGPFGDKQDPRYFQDNEYRWPVSGNAATQEIVRGLLQTDPCNRLSVNEALQMIRQAQVRPELRNMTLAIKNSKSGKTTNLAVAPTYTIDIIKQMIYAQEDIPLQEQQLIFAGKVLEGSRTLCDYNLMNDTIIHLVPVVGA